MRYLRFIFGVCALSLVMATTAFGKSLEYKAGKAAAYIDHCGHYDLNLALHKKYGKSQDYKTGELDTALQTGKGSSHKVNNLGCEELEGFIKKLFNASAQASNINEAENIPFSECAFTDLPPTVGSGELGSVRSGSKVVQFVPGLPGRCLIK